MFLCNDVIQLKRSVGVFRRQAAVFTPIGGSLTHQISQSLIHELRRLIQGESGFQLHAIHKPQRAAVFIQVVFFEG